MDLTEEKTGKRHLDDLTGPERADMVQAIEAQPSQQRPYVPGDPIDTDMRKAVDAPIDEQAEPQAEPHVIQSSAGSLAVIDRMYRDILDDTKTVFRMKRDQKDAWKTVKRIDRLIQDGVKSGLDYGAAAAKVPAQDLAALTAILEQSGKTTAKNHVPATPDLVAKSEPVQAASTPDAVFQNPQVERPRSELPIEQNMEMQLRAEKAQADMEIAGQERGGRTFIEQHGHGSTPETIGFKSATADWYKELTTGPRPLKRAQIETAIQKIIKDHGVDVGVAVERVKEAILRDREFNKTPWGEDADAIARGEWPSWIEKPAPTETSQGNGGTKQESAIDKAMRSVGLDPNAPPGRAKELRRKAERLSKEAMAILEGIPAGQPIRSTADRNRRERSAEKMRKAGDLLRQAEELESKSQPETPPTPDLVLTAPTANPVKPKSEDLQTSIEIPPETIGSRPIIGRETTPEESPLFSKAAQEPEAEQTQLSKPSQDRAQQVPSVDPTKLAFAKKGSTVGFDRHGNTITMGYLAPSKSYTVEVTTPTGTVVSSHRFATELDARREAASRIDRDQTRKLAWWPVSGLVGKEPSSKLNSERPNPSSPRQGGPPSHATPDSREAERAVSETVRQNTRHPRCPSCGIGTDEEVSNDYESSSSA